MTSSAVVDLLSLVEDAIDPESERYKKWMQDARRGVVRAALLLGVILYVASSDQPDDRERDAEIVSGWGKLLIDATALRVGGGRYVYPVNPATLLEIKGRPAGWEWAMSLEDADDFLERHGLGFKGSDILAYWRGDPSPYTSVEPATAQTVPVQRSESEQDMGSTALKKSALITKHRSQWPTIEADLSEASRNGLGVARVKHGFWDESAALGWAKRNGKIRQGSPMNSLFPTRRIRGV